MAETQTEKRKETDLGNGFLRVDIQVKDSNRPEGQQMVPHSYQIPTLKNFLKWVGTLPETSELAGKREVKDSQGEISKVQNPSQEQVYEFWAYATDMRERASVRIAVAAESTVIKKDGKEIDLLALDTDPVKAIKKACAAVNAAYGLVAVVGGEPQAAFRATRKKLMEAGSVKEQNGMILPK